MSRIKMDKDTGFKWLFLIGAGLLGIFANIFSTRHNDRVFKETVREKVQEKLDALTEKTE